MKKVLIALAVGTLLAGCAPQAVQPQKTSLEIQAIQARVFDADKRVTFNAVMSILQDLGYIIGSASLETGFITAESPSKEADHGAAVFAKIFGGVRTEGKTAVTVSIEEIGPKKTRVRLNLVDRQSRSSAYGQRASDDTPIVDPKIYNTAFDKIGEAIFIRQSQTSSQPQASPQPQTSSQPVKPSK
jgi:hypothetical protein